jgi:hypothetical protein
VVRLVSCRFCLGLLQHALSHDEMLFDLNGGTLEVLVVAVLAGYKQVAYIGDENERVKMQFLNLDQTVDWDECPPAKRMQRPASDIPATRECPCVSDHSYLQVHLPGTWLRRTRVSSLLPRRGR